MIPRACGQAGLETQEEKKAKLAAEREAKKAAEREAKQAAKEQEKQAKEAEKQRRLKEKAEKEEAKGPKKPLSAYFFYTAATREVSQGTVSWERCCP